MSLSAAQLEQFVSRLAMTSEIWRPLVQHCDGARVYEQIWDADELNAWLICWSRDHDTGFHDHDDSAAAIRVIEGRVREDRLRLGAPPNARVFGPGETFIVPPTAIHRVLHAGAGPAVTLHAYSPPLRRVGEYQIGPRGELLRTAQPYEHELRAETALS